MGNQVLKIEDCNIEDLYENSLMGHDISAHLTILKEYSDKCKSVLELGFRGGISTTAFLHKETTSVDWDRYPFLVDKNRVSHYKKIANFSIVYKNSLELSLEKNYDLLFIDTFHTYECLLYELCEFSKNIDSFILIHDVFEPTCPGMRNAIEDFLRIENHWEVEKVCGDRPGLIILKRRSFGHTEHDTSSLKESVNWQMDLYYKNVNEKGSINPDWADFVLSNQQKYQNPLIWPWSNRGLTKMFLEQE